MIDHWLDFTNEQETIVRRFCTDQTNYTGVSLIVLSLFLVCKPKHVVRLRKVIDLHYEDSILSFSTVNAVYFHELDSELILLFRQ